MFTGGMDTRLDVLEHETPPALRIERWRGHRADIAVKIDRGRITFICRDVYEALGLDLDLFEAQPDRLQPAAERLNHCTTWDLDRLTYVLSTLTAPVVTEFIDWAAAKVDEIQQLGTEAVERASVPKPTPITTLGHDAEQAAPADTMPEWYSVADAAAILSRDPAITIGQARLFDWMRDRGWVNRPGTAWEPARDLVSLGYLRVVTRRIRATKQLYPQVCITPFGLQQLHERLGGIATINLTHPTLNDPELTEEQK